MERGRKLNSYDDLWGSRARDNVVLRQLGFPTVIKGALAPEHQTSYQVMFRIAEITSKLRMNDITPPMSRNRSPSPPPVYDNRGKRTNTREQRYRRKLEEERHRLVEIALKMIPHFIAPDDYKRPSKFQDKYFIPADEYPEINFVGLLLGPRGNTLKKLQQESGCKISIRGRGSVRSGKSMADLPKGASNMNEPLHCIIIADTEDKIPLGIKACESIVIKAITSPEGQNDLKRGQLRELAVLNGTLREDNYVQTFGRKRMFSSETDFAHIKRFRPEGSASPIQSEAPLSSESPIPPLLDKSKNTNTVSPSLGSSLGSHPTTDQDAHITRSLPPGVRESNVAEFSPSGLSAPGVSAPGLSAPGLSAPGLSAPGLSAPGLSAPGLSAPGLSAPGLSAPGLSAPGLSAPGVSAPGLSELIDSPHAAKNQND